MFLPGRGESISGHNLQIHDWLSVTGSKHFGNAANSLLNEGEKVIPPISPNRYKANSETGYILDFIGGIPDHGRSPRATQ